MPDGHALLLGLLAVFIILGYLTYTGVKNTTKSSVLQSTPSPVVVTNYTIIIPQGLYNGGDIPSYKVSMRKRYQPSK